MVRVVEGLPSKHQALVQVPNTTKKIMLCVCVCVYFLGFQAKN
jgi:hypothetical protein